MEQITTSRRKNVWSVLNIRNGRLMVFSATFNNSSVISWESVCFIGGGNQCLHKTTNLSQVTDKVYYIMLYLVHLVWARFELTTSVVIDTDCIGIIVNPKTIRTWSQWPFYIRDNLCSTNWIMYVIFLLPRIPLEAEIKIKIMFICLI